MKRVFALLLLSMFLLGCLGQQSAAPSDSAAAGDAAVLNESELAENGAFEVTEESSEISELDISDEEINETLGG